MILLKRFACRSIRRSLPDYVTLRLSSEARDRVERHLAVCRECSAEHLYRSMADLAHDRAIAGAIARLRHRFCSGAESRARSSEASLRPRFHCQQIA